MKNFYCKVAPNIRDKAFHPVGGRVNLKLLESDDCAMLTIFHRIEQPCDEEVDAAVKDLIDMQVLAGDNKNPVGRWKELFKQQLRERNEKFFATSEEELKFYRTGIFGRD